MGSRGPVNENVSLYAEIEMFVQTKVKTKQNVTTAATQERQVVAQQPEPQENLETEKNKISKKKTSREQGALPAVITVLLLTPLLVVISIGVYICRRKNGMYDNKVRGQCIENSPDVSNKKNSNSHCSKFAQKKFYLCVVLYPLIQLSDSTHHNVIRT